MNKKLPYEEAFEQQLHNLPLPDQDASWQKMRALLDEKERRRPLAFFNTNQGKGILSLLLVLGFLVVMHASRHVSSVAPLHGTQVAAQGNGVTNRKTPLAGSSANSGVRSSQSPSAQPAEGASTINPSLTHRNPLPPADANPLSRKVPGGKNNQTGIARSKNLFAPGYDGMPVQRGLLNKKASLPALQPRGKKYREHPVQTSLFEASSPTAILQNHVSGLDLTPTIILADKPRLSLSGLHKTAGEKNKTELDKPYQSFFVSAGIGLQQQIPLGGQKRVAFNLNGNKNPLSDYIPSFFLRLEKEQRWYVQAEFSWATPKLVKSFSYSRQTRIDSPFHTVTTNLLLKKVFYRELPVSFNYYLRPNWSAGAGATYSWFRGAITEKQMATRNLQTQTSALDKQLVPIEHYTDSFLYRSHTYLMLQTNYEVKNLSLGLRFSGDVQPYMKYTLPDGSVADKRNWSLELLVRLGLWRSGRF